MTADEQAQPHRWRFERLGGFPQVLLESGEDICCLDQLDQRLWAVLSCPTAGLHFDSHTLLLLDADGDGRIRVPEVLAAARWLCEVLGDSGALLQPQQALPLSAIDMQTDQGRALLASAKVLLERLGASADARITPEQTLQAREVFNDAAGLNGDGVVPIELASDEATAAAIGDIIDCLGPVVDRSGADGIDQDRVDRFFSDLDAYIDWWEEAEQGCGRVLPLGEATEQAAAALDAVRAKIDDYFLRARLAEFDPAAADMLNPAQGDYGALALTALSADSPELRAFPLARAEPSRPLPLGNGDNPAWSAEVGALRDQVVQPLLGSLDSLTEGQWRDLDARFSGYREWRAARRGDLAAPLGIARARELAAPEVRAQINALIERDLELKPVADAVDAVDRLVHLYCHFCQFLNNFVSLRDFYTRGSRASFEAGTLYLDRRSCRLCVQVSDIEAHSRIAEQSRIFLAYCECRRRDGGDRMLIAAAITAGHADYLSVGRNGVFYDRDGGDWDATIVKLVEHAISVRAAFWTPYRRIGSLLGDQLERFAGSRDDAVVKAGADDVSALSANVAKGTKGVPAPFDIARFAGIFAALGLAVGAIATAVASMITGLLGLTPWKMLLAFGGLVLAVSGPSMLLAYINLRRRNLGPLLDANSWAVNTRAQLSVPFGESLTRLASLPHGARWGSRGLRPGRFGRWIALLVLVSIAVFAALSWRMGLPWGSSASRPAAEVSQDRQRGADAQPVVPSPAPAGAKAKPD